MSWKVEHGRSKAFNTGAGESHSFADIGLDKQGLGARPGKEHTQDGGGKWTDPIRFTVKKDQLVRNTNNGLKDMGLRLVAKI